MKLRSFDNGASTRVLNMLKTFSMTVGKTVVERVTVVKFRVICAEAIGTPMSQLHYRFRVAKFGTLADGPVE